MIFSVWDLFAIDKTEPLLFKLLTIDVIHLALHTGIRLFPVPVVYWFTIFALEYSNCIPCREVRLPPATAKNGWVLGMTLKCIRWWGSSFGAQVVVKSLVRHPDLLWSKVIIVIYEALCFDVAQGQMNGAPNENRTHSCRFASQAC